MMTDRPLRVVVLGSGGVASSLATAIDALSCARVTQIYSPTADHARALASCMNEAKAVTEPHRISSDADLYIISVKDDAIAPLISTIVPTRPDAVWAHTSGSVPIDVLAPLSANTAVIYPLMTFTRGRTIDMRTVPLFVEASDDATCTLIKQLCDMLSDSVYKADSALRRRLHVTAVFGCNFANHMWAIAEELLRADNLPFDVLKPLLEETLAKALSSTGPGAGQTGPARRGDTTIIDSHAKSLPEPLAQLYLNISQSIINHYHDTI